MSAAEHLTAALAELRAGVEAIDQYAVLPELAEIAYLLDQIKAATTAARADVNEQMKPEMGEKVVTVGNLRVEGRTGMRRKEWDSEGLLGHLAARSVVTDLETCEMRSPEERFDAFYEYVAKCMPITKSLGWRSTALKAIGVDPSEWSSWAPGATTFHVHLVEPGEGEAA